MWALKVQTDKLVPELERQHQEIMRELEQEQAEVASIEECDEEYLNELKASIAEQKYVICVALNSAS